MSEPRIPFEGSVPLLFSPRGKGKGPARRAPVFYNPAMRMNRDITVCMVQALSDAGSLPGKAGIKLLDGLCGTGIRGMRLLKEVDWKGRDVEVRAVDNNPLAIEAGTAMAASIGAPLEFLRVSLNSHLYEKRYSYIDVDPYGSPLPFVPAALSSILPGGTIALTATDTAALCGSNRKVALRRYGADLIKTEYIKEISCRVLLCSVARIAASMDLALEPLLFFASDHYVRGFLRVTRGAKKADEIMGSIGRVGYDPPQMPIPFPPDEVGISLGPMWLGPLEDPIVLEGMKKALSDEAGISRFMATKKQILRIVDLSLGEHGLPPFGFDTDALASHLSASPPAMDRLVTGLRALGFASARSRFGDKVLRTEADFTDIRPLFKEV
jgi:tRNA (guanine26-N2/guanine27-N2)-dimethyltransferase